MLSTFIQKMKDNSCSLRTAALFPLQPSKFTVTLWEGIKEGFQKK